MKLKLKKEGGGWASGIYRGKGGISSLTAARHTNSFWHAISLFSVRNFIHHIQLVMWSKRHNK